MAEGIWQKLVVQSLLLWIPAVILLGWNAKSNKDITTGQRRSSTAFKIAVVVAGGYAAWVVFGVSRLFGAFLLFWPVMGTILSLLGFICSIFASRAERLRLGIANVLLLVLCVASIIPPN